MVSQSVFKGPCQISSLYNRSLFLSGNPAQSPIGFDSSAVLNCDSKRVIKGFNSLFPTKINAVIEAEDVPLGVPSAKGAFPVDGDLVVFAKGLDPTVVNIYDDGRIFAQGAPPPGMALTLAEPADASHFPNAVFQTANETDNKQKWVVQQN